MSDVWQAGDTVTSIAEDLLGKYHTEVATANFGYAFKAKATNSEIEAGIIAKAKKVSPLLKIFTKDELDFIIEIAKPLWDELSPDEQRAHLDSALCSCTAKIDEGGDFKLTEAGDPIYVLKPYDLQGHSEIIQRWGIDTFAEVGARIKAALNKHKEDADK